MSDSMKSYMPNEFWAVSDCVDAYESQAGDGFPNLKTFSQRAEPAFQVAALVELVKVDMERRWRGGDRRKIEQYLQEYPELSTSSPLVEDLLRQEFLVRSSHGDTPTIDECHNRFPTVDGNRVITSEPNINATLALGDRHVETEEFDGQPLAEQGPSGTIVYDTKAPETQISKASINPRSQMSRTAPDSVSRSSQAPTPSVVRQPRVEPTPTAIGRYTIKKELGSGSFGMVYRCYDEDLHRDVAIKVPHRRRAAQDRVKEFLHEAQSAARLRHANIVTVLDTNQTDDGRVYIVYEYIPGQTMQDSLEKGGYSYDDVVRWVAETADALHHAHKNGIVHRDIKPANILIDEENRPHVADFGLAKMDDQFFKDDTGKVLGTVAYMSPEQAVGESHWATPQTDIYSLGVVLYQMLTHKLPFSSGSIEEVLEQVKKRPPAPPRTIDDNIPKPLEEVCLKAIAKVPGDRYHTAADMAADLRKALVVAPPVRSSRGSLAAMGGFAAAASVALLLWAPWRQHDEQPLLVPATGGQEAEPFADLPPGTPKLSIHYQGAKEKGVWQPMSGKKFALHEGDKVQLHVALSGGTQRYVYLYWYDAEGHPVRLWPLDLANQQKVAEVSSPQGVDEWHAVDSERGAEMALVAVRDDPLDASELAEFETHPAFDKNAVRLSEVYHVASGEVSRGLTGVVKSRKTPLEKDFEKSLSGEFGSYHGMVIPHQ